MISVRSTTPRVVVLDMQPIEPPVGGGRLRLLGLYHALGERFKTTYVGTFDWRGEKVRRLNLSDCLTEIDIPLSEAHFEAADAMSRSVGGKVVIDVTFSQLAWLSEDYSRAAREEASTADVIVFSHPWIYPIVKDVIDRRRQLLIYDAQNVEGFLRAQLFDDGTTPGAEIARGVVAVESEVCQAVDRIIACSQADRLLFTRLYGVAAERIEIVPNGTFTRRPRRSEQVTKEDLKRILRLPEGPAALFLASAYPPNVEAAVFIRDHLAARVPHVTFVIAGGVGGGFTSPSALPENVVVTGFLSDAEKEDLLGAIDIAVNPMFSGSGTNIKMLEYLAAGLPVVATPTGARGIEQGRFLPAFVVCESDAFADSLTRLASSPEEMVNLAARARALADEHYSWERISPDLGSWIDRLAAHHGRPHPTVSVVVATYERHDRLTALMELLEQQTTMDFEVIVVDQSERPWPGRHRDWGFDLHYDHSDIKGVVRARNRGAQIARGEILAFTDDDCEPRPEWIANAIRHFEEDDILGIEGLIESKHRFEAEYRAVTNEGFVGIGFMTANLFLRKSAFNLVGGFDLRFDHPHFREDSDLAWRVLEHGAIPFCHDVAVFHPPHPTTVVRESAAERVRFFEKDPLLLKRHPDRYRQLFLAEGHWQFTAGYWENFFRGAEQYGIDVPDWVMVHFAESCRRRGLFDPPDSPPEQAESVPQAVDPVAVAPSDSVLSTVERRLVDSLLDVTEIDLPIKPPGDLYAPNDSRIDELLEETTAIYARAGTDLLRDDYFTSSVLRYRHYLSLLTTLAPGSRVLDVGSAPGHMSICMHLLGFELTAVNLNAEYRSLYPSDEWLSRLNVMEADIESEPLPFSDGLFDVVVFTEVLQHIAVRSPVDVLRDLLRVLRRGGMFLLSTPNVCNISNIMALTKGDNVFWRPEDFFGSLDRHNREYTPHEIGALLRESGFSFIKIYGINSPSNWHGRDDFPYRVLTDLSDESPLLRNTIVAVAMR